ncbi:hypothetical protein, partial [Streptacidiphilus anmyonensis]|uniref:hypothetical protein n=1 Tax=Streptacidiphilus anmyonensis TaxID=405782 RepID=UPI0005A7DB9E
MTGNRPPSSARPVTTSNAPPIRSACPRTSPSTGAPIAASNAIRNRSPATGDNSPDSTQNGSSVVPVGDNRTHDRNTPGPPAPSPEPSGSGTRWACSCRAACRNCTRCKPGACATISSCACPRARPSSTGASSRASTSTWSADNPPPAKAARTTGNRSSSRANRTIRSARPRDICPCVRRNPRVERDRTANAPPERSNNANRRNFSAASRSSNRSNASNCSAWKCAPAATNTSSPSPANAANTPCTPTGNVRNAST